MNYEKRIREYFVEFTPVLQQVDHKQIQALSAKINETMRRKKNIFVFGNGGCSTLAAHFSTDLGKMLKLERNENYRIISLNDNMSAITAWANDTGYENIFWRQLELFLQPGDLVFALSGSGNSENVVQAAMYAKKQDNFVISLAGFGGGRLAQNSDICCLVPSHNMQVVEDAFSVILHAIFVTLRDTEVKTPLVRRTIAQNGVKMTRILKGLTSRRNQPVAEEAVE